MSYPGLRGSRVSRYKYADCEHSKVRGITVRLLMPTEIEEFKAHINAIINLRSSPRKLHRSFT
jgi:hypothetical protein